ncbi:MAG: DUF3299 domain-containing protein [Bacteroidota bacterium]
MNASFLLFLSLLTAGMLHTQPLRSQIKLSWDDLYDVTFEENPGSEFQCPTFGDDLQALDGYKVYLTGYVLPLNMAENKYVLSAFTFASCFFCGGAGPESVLQLELKTANRNYRTDEWKRFKGTFRLNDWDAEKMYYLLEEAEEY